MGSKKRVDTEVEKELTGSDIILNLDAILIDKPDGTSSSYCSGRASFEIQCHTENGYCEDPDFAGTISVIEARKEGKGVYTLKVKYTRAADENEPEN